VLVFTTTRFRPRSRNRKAIPHNSTRPKTGFVEFSPVYNSRVTKAYPSVDTSACDTSRKESPKYTGSLIKGIATMHKSNAVPVLNEQDAVDISRMRR
jgi:hypothetical protein